MAKQEDDWHERNSLNAWQLFCDTEVKICIKAK